MATAQFKRWRINYDPEATRKAYTQVLQGCPEQCGCDTCKNFAAARHCAYPPEAKALFEQLGININQEPEVYHNSRIESGLHSYGGWFHFVGSIEEGRDASQQIAENIFGFDLEQITDSFAMGLTKRVTLVPGSFVDQQVVQIEFETKIPWVIDSKEAE
jgi:hypothetical protein